MQFAGIRHAFATYMRVDYENKFRKLAVAGEGVQGEGVQGHDPFLN